MINTCIVNRFSRDLKALKGFKIDLKGSDFFLPNLPPPCFVFTINDFTAGVNYYRIA